MSIDRIPFGAPEAELFRLTNRNGTTLAVTNFGATLVELWCRDRAGELADIALGFDEVADYASPYLHYLGVTAGRCGNRIRNGCFELDGQRHELSRNYHGHHLNGGELGFGRRTWQLVRMEDEDSASTVTFAYRSPAGEEGYPGTLDAQVTYRLSAEDVIDVIMEATTDAPTVVNMFNHSYFNLKGHDRGDITNHRVEIAADFWLPVDDQVFIVTGEVHRVDGTPFDFRREKSIAAAIEESGAVLDYGYALSNGVTPELRHVATVSEQSSGRRLRYLTNNASVHMYDGGHMPAGFKGKRGAVYGPHSGLSLETQSYPNAINIPHFPSPVIRPQERYRHRLRLELLTF